MKIGFTGTRHGMTRDQKDYFRSEVCEVDEFHHGDCDGSDEDAHWIARSEGAWIVIHPPTISAHRARCKGDEARAAKAYIDRNHDIVNETQFLIATPREFQEVVRSGTWATIRYAKKIGRPILIIFPDGSVEKIAGKEGLF